MPSRELSLIFTGENKAEDEAGLMRLGAAVVMLWLRMPKEFQEEALSMVDRITGVPELPDAAERIRILAERNRFEGR